MLEYCSQIGRPCYASFLSRLESCQRRLTKWCKQIRNLSYENRLSTLQLPTLDKRLKRGDLILTYQILNQIFDVKPGDYFCFAPSTTRGNNTKLVGTISNINIRHRFFTERVINHWNALPAEVVNAPTLNSFKARLDRLF